jgi:hypothetical protein
MVSRAVIYVAGWLVPGPDRGEWRREWRAELAGRRAELVRAGRLDYAAQLDLVERALGSFRDGAGVRLVAAGHEWRARPGGALGAIGFLAISIGLLATGIRSAWLLAGRGLPNPGTDWRLVSILIAVAVAFLGSAARAARWCLVGRTDRVAAASTGPVVILGVALGAVVTHLIAGKIGSLPTPLDSGIIAGLGWVSGLMLGRSTVPG